MLGQHEWLAIGAVFLFQVSLQNLKPAEDMHFCLRSLGFRMVHSGSYLPFVGYWGGCNEGVVVKGPAPGARWASNATVYCEKFHLER